MIDPILVLFGLFAYAITVPFASMILDFTCEEKHYWRLALVWPLLLALRLPVWIAAFPRFLRGLWDDIKAFNQGGKP